MHTCMTTHTIYSLTCLSFLCFIVKFPESSLLFGRVKANRSQAGKNGMKQIYYGFPGHQIPWSFPDLFLVSKYR